MNRNCKKFPNSGKAFPEEQEKQIRKRKLKPRESS